MESCPFCGAEVDEELILYGGNCPACLNLIPGEEAPTNPGVQARANAELEAEVSRKRSSTPVIIGVLGIVLLVVGGVVTQSGPEEIRPDPYEIEINTDLSSHVNPDKPDESAAEPEVQPATAELAQPRLPTGGQVAAATPAPVDRGSVGPTGPSGGINSFDPGVAISPLAGVTSGSSKILTSEAEISSMIKDTMTTYKARMQRCYNSRLNERPELRGTWNVALTVTRQGKAARVNVAGRDVSDEVLERCLTQCVSRFSFQKIAEDRPISYPLTFGT